MSVRREVRYDRTGLPATHWETDGRARCADPFIITSRSLKDRVWRQHDHTPAAGYEPTPKKVAVLDLRDVSLPKPVVVQVVVVDEDAAARAYWGEDLY